MIDYRIQNEVDSVERVVCEQLGVDTKEIVNRRTTSDISLARSFIFYILHVNMKYKVRTICDIYGRKQNGVFKRIAKMRFLIKNYKMYKKMYQDICKEL